MDAFRFTVEGLSYSYGEQFFAAEKSCLSRDHQTLQHTCACSNLALTSNMDEKSVTSILPCGNASEKIVCLSALTRSSPKIQSCNHITWARATGFSRKLALTTSNGTSSTGLTTSLPAAPMVRLKFLRKALQTVERLFRDRAPPPTRHQPVSPQGDSPSSRDCIFMVDPSK